MLKGMICLWFGLINAIPDGWLVCDGTHDTPDLRNRFVVCAGDTYAPGDNSAVITHTHDDSYTAGVHHMIAGTDIGLGFVVNMATLFTTDTFTTDAEKAEPPYHALAYIMKEG